MTYRRRLPLVAHSSFKLMDDSFCYFVVRSQQVVHDVTAAKPDDDDGKVVDDDVDDNDEEESAYVAESNDIRFVEDAIVIRPSFLELQPSVKDGDVSLRIYRSPIYAGLYHKGLYSPDLSLGLEINKDFSLRLYRVEPLRKLMTLRGHTSDINATVISADNKYLATGSFDNTVRLWSLSSGESLCKFHLYGNVCSVAMTPNTEHVIARYYSAPQRTRAAILNVRNLKE